MRSGRLQGIPGTSLKKYWFFFALLVIFIATWSDRTELFSAIGRWLNTHGGTAVTIFLLFFFSGLVLNAEHIRSGLIDLEGIFISLAVIFLVSPLTAALAARMPLDTGIKIGIFLVAAMPTTLSSGVVMTGAAGGNMAQALVITILANSLAVGTIPVILSLLLKTIGGSGLIIINEWAILSKLFYLVIVPLVSGFIFNRVIHTPMQKREQKIQTVNQWLVLCIVWMALSQTKGALLAEKGEIGIVIAAVSGFHLVLLGSAALLILIFKLETGRRESVLFMGSQKTLPLSVVLQASLFPQHGMALIVCVVHHIVHLLMDGYLVGRLQKRV